MKAIRAVGVKQSLTKTKRKRPHFQGTSTEENGEISLKNTTEKRQRQTEED